MWGDFKSTIDLCYSTAEHITYIKKSMVMVVMVNVGKGKEKTG